MSKYDKTTFESLYNDGSVGKPFQTNTSRAITSAIDRQFAKDISDSFLFALTGPDTDVLFSFQDDFLTQGIGINIGGTGSATQVTTGVNSTEKALGVFAFSVSAVADYVSPLITALPNLLFGIGHAITLRFRCAVSAVSDGTNRYKLNLGFGDSFLGADHANGAYFRYVDNVNGGKYQCVTVQGSTETTSDSGITPVATVNNVFQIQVDDTGTHVYFSIDGTVVQTHTTNIPVGAAQFVGGTLKIYKTLGAAARILNADWCQFLITRSSVR